MEEDEVWRMRCGGDASGMEDRSAMALLPCQPQQLDWWSVM
jgi:hypothetical protein